MDKKQFSPTQNPNKNGKRGMKNIGFFALIILVGLVVFSAYGQPSNLKDVPFSEVIKSANAGEIKQISIQGDDIQVIKKGEEKPSEKSRKETGSSIYEQGLTNRDVAVV